MKMRISVIDCGIDIGEGLEKIRSQLHCVSYRSTNALEVGIHCAVARRELRKIIRVLNHIEALANADEAQEKAAVVLKVAKP